MNRLALPACLLALSALAAACASDEPASDAFGTFEATTTIVSSETSGRLLTFTGEEGQTLAAGEVVGLVDTTQLALQRAQLEARRRSVRAKLPGVTAQVEVLQEQRRIAERDRARIERLLASEAATPKQLDDIEGQIQVIDRQIASIRSQNPSILGELEAVEAQLAQVEDQIRRSVLANPVAGTVLAAYAEPYEMTAAGKPLYQIAPLDPIYLRAYVSGAQLPHVRLGQPATVLVDRDESTNQELPGEVTWIASEAEFTPKTIQTKEERVRLVYALKVRVPNPDGMLKIGMPGEVRFNQP